MYHKMIEQLPDHEYSIEQIKAENEKLKDELNTAEKAFYEKREADAYRAGYEDGKRDAVKHGYWVGEFSKERLSLDEDGRVETGFECAVCSECGEDLLASEEYFVRGRYCPSCGAKMDGKEQKNGQD